MCSSKKQWCSTRGRHEAVVSKGRLEVVFLRAKSVHDSLERSFLERGPYAKVVSRRKHRGVVSRW